MNIAPQNNSTNQPQDKPLSSYYNSCYKIPFSNFKDVICDNDYSALVISGEPTEFELLSAWANIYYEFIDLSEDSDNLFYKRLRKKIIELNITIIKVECYVWYLAVQWDEDIVKDLHSMNYNYPFDPNDKVQYTKDLQLVLSRLINIKINLQIANDELESYENKFSGEKPDRNYFIQTEILLSKHNGYRINPKEITAAEFCILKNQYAKHYAKH